MAFSTSHLLRLCQICQASPATSLVHHKAHGLALSLCLCAARFVSQPTPRPLCGSVQQVGSAWPDSGLASGLWGCRTGERLEFYLHSGSSCSINPQGKLQTSATAQGCECPPPVARLGRRFERDESWAVCRVCTLVESHIPGAESSLSSAKSGVSMSSNC